MLKRFAVIVGCSMFFASCNRLEKDDAIKMAMAMKMQGKVQKVSAELKAYCDSEIYRKARWKADSILLKRRLHSLK